MKKEKFKKFAEKHPRYKIEMLLPKGSQEKSGIIFFSDGAFQIVEYFLLFRIGKKTLTETVKSSDDVCPSCQAMQQWIQEREYKEILISISQEYQGVLVEPEVTVLDEDAEGSFFFACKYISSIRENRINIALIAYAPESEGIMARPYFGKIDAGIYDLLAAVIGEKAGESIG